MQKRNFIKRAFDAVRDIHQKDYDNCATLTELTGLQWKPTRDLVGYSDTAYTIYETPITNPRRADAQTQVLKKFLMPHRSFMDGIYTVYSGDDIETSTRACSRLFRDSYAHIHGLTPTDTESLKTEWAVIDKLYPAKKPKSWLPF